jgi:type II secretory pathway component PulC
MQKGKRSGVEAAPIFSGGERAADRISMAMRPAVEAALVAAVAFGCAQAGWAVLTPNTAGASAANNTMVRADGAEIDMLAAAPVRSPFEPALAELDAGSNAASAMLSNLKLSGVRVSTVAERSSAVLAMADGAHRAYRVGEEIAAGVRLAEVAADYVLLSYPGGQRQLEMPAAPPSYARALMGQIDAPAAAVAAVANGAGASRVAQQALSASDLTPFAPIAPIAARAEPLQLTEPALLATPLLPAVSAAAAPSGSVAVAPNALVQAPGSPATAVSAIPAAQELGGWRLPAEVPAAARALGLQAGDLIVAINGAEASQAAAMAALAGAGPVQFSVKRGDELRTFALTLPEPMSTQ